MQSQQIIYDPGTEVTIKNHWAYCLAQDRDGSLVVAMSSNIPCCISVPNQSDVTWALWLLNSVPIVFRKTKWTQEIPYKKSSNAESVFL